MSAEQRRLMFALAVRQHSAELGELYLRRRDLRRPYAWLEERIDELNARTVDELIDICRVTEVPREHGE